MIVIAFVSFFFIWIEEEPPNLIIVFILLMMKAFGFIMLTVGIKTFMNEGRVPPDAGYT